MNPEIFVAALIGLVVGGSLGVLLMACLVAARQADEGRGRPCD